MLLQQKHYPAPITAPHGLDIAAGSCSRERVGGDYYDIIPIAGDLNSRRALVAIGDVSGHGVAAALVMSTARGILRSSARSCSSPGVLLTHLNDLLAFDVAKGCFMTMQLGLIDLDTQEMTWAGAGHDPVLLFDPIDDRFHEIKSHGIPLGIEPGTEYEERSYAGPRPGQVLALGTDGIWETRNPDGEMFGKKRLRECIRATADRSAAEMIAFARDEVDTFRDSARSLDDLTLLIIKVLQDVDDTVSDRQVLYGGGGCGRSTEKPGSGFFGPSSQAHRTRNIG